MIRSVSTGVYIYLVFQGGVSGTWCLEVCDMKCKHGCIYLFGVSGCSQWKLVFGGGCDTKCKHGCIYLFGVSGWSQWNLVFGGVCDYEV